MKLGGLIRGIGSVVKVAGPIAGGLGLGGPVGGGLAVLSQLAGGAEKKRGQKAEKAHAALGQESLPIHKVSAPIAAIATPAAIAGLLQQFGIVDLPHALSLMCNGGELSAIGFGILMGLIALLSHQIGHGIQDATQTRVRRDLASGNL